MTQSQRNRGNITDEANKAKEIKIGSLGIDKTNGSLDKTTTMKSEEEEERRGEREKEGQDIISSLGYKVTSPASLRLMKA